MIWDCYIKREQYKSCGLALELISADDDEHILMATTCVLGVLLGPEEVVIKNYSENEGILDILISSGIVCPTSMIVQTGFVQSPIVRVNMDVLKYYEKDTESEAQQLRN